MINRIYESINGCSLEQIEKYEDMANFLKDFKNYMED